ncbi:hypothetical protein GCM10011391_19180 [Pullulanibacillus camelliae]|uniref:SCP domain-containing protein n=1 Tax=Pullulanibacillus camelliae TaxID=1707096 RepID=A0A8J2YF58_9BACL|nr:CAP domain-containing protein [Pullulanibacillus camelliae]GGE40579.1 hypothetical protein GCM10011391_19180 [Pullulanibacillus camelliae]
MKKQMLMLAFAGMVALPFTQGHTANAQTTDSPSQQTQQKVIHVNFKSLEDLQSHYKDLYTKFLKEGKGFCNGESTAENKNNTSKPAAANTTQQQTSKQQAAAPAPSKGSAAAPSSKSTDTVSAYEKEVVTLTNKERTSRGLKPLTLNTKLSKMARDKSQDMVNKNYFSHQSPTYGSPFDMMKAYNISYTSAGENIAAGQKTPQEVVTAWMNSEGHRENILNPNYTTIGVGYVKGGSYGSYWTQEFIGK